MRTDGVQCREFAGTGPVVLKVVPVTGAAFAGHHGPIIVRLSFPIPSRLYWYQVGMLQESKTSSIWTLVLQQTKQFLWSRKLESCIDRHCKLHIVPTINIDIVMCYLTPSQLFISSTHIVPTGSTAGAGYLAIRS